MRGREKIAIISLFILLSSLGFTKLGSAQSDRPTLRFEPTYYTGRAGSTFTAKVYIQDAGEYLVDNTEVYAYQVMPRWDSSLLDITDLDVTFGDFMDTPRIGSWGILTQDAPAGQDIVYVTDGSKFANPGAWGALVLIQDDSNSEYKKVVDQSGGQLTLNATLAHSYTMAAGGGAYPWPTLTRSAVPGPAPASRITVGETTNGPCPGVSGSGLLFTLTFTVKAEGTTTIDIDAPTFGAFTYIVNTIGEFLGDDPSGSGDPGYYQSELYKESGYFILPWVEDFNGDGSIDIFDLASVALRWGETGAPGWIPEDLDDDGDIDIVDLSMVSIKFGAYANA